MRQRVVAAAVLTVCATVAVVLWERSEAHSAETRRRSEAAAAINDGVVRTVVLGDSVAHGAGDERGNGIAGSLDREFQTLRIRASAVLNFGINGARVRNVSDRLRVESVRSAIRGADLVILSIGGNDLYGDSPARLLSRLVPIVQQYRTLRRLERLVASIREINPAARVYLLGLYNPYRQSAIGSWLDRQVNLWDGRIILRFASANDVRVVRIHDLLDRPDRLSRQDHFHPGAEGYRAIAARIAASL